MGPHCVYFCLTISFEISKHVIVRGAVWECDFDCALLVGVHFCEPPSVGARRLFFASCNHVWGHARMCERPPIVVCYFSEAVECDFRQFSSRMNMAGHTRS